MITVLNKHPGHNSASNLNSSSLVS